MNEKAGLVSQDEMTCMELACGRSDGGEQLDDWPGRVRLCKTGQVAGESHPCWPAAQSLEGFDPEMSPGMPLPLGHNA